MDSLKIGPLIAVISILGGLYAINWGMSRIFPEIKRDDKFDKNGYFKQDENEFDNDEDPREKEKQNTLTYHHLTPPFISIIGMLTKVAKSDGKISQQEATVITSTINKFINATAVQFKVPISELKPLRQQLLEVHKNAKQDATPISTYALYLSHQSLDEKREILTQLISIAIIDGYSNKKESLIYEVGKSLNISNIQIKRLIDKIVVKPEPEPPIDKSSPYYVLRCQSSDSNATIKKQYRLLIKKYHPDFIHSKDLDESFIEFANKKLQEVNRAYETIKKERGL